MDSKLKFNSLQYLRGLSAIAVVLFHLETGINQYLEKQNYISLFSWGKIGVPMFFCLSGFVIAYSGYLKPKKLLDFLFTRVARIYPIYLLTTALYIALIILIPQKAFNSDVNLSIEKLTNTLFFGFGGASGYIFVGWTLYYEMVFYILFPPLSYKFNELVRRKIFFYATSIGIVISNILNPLISSFFIGISIFMIISKSKNQSYFSTPYFILLISLAMEFFNYPVGLFCGALIFGVVKLEKKKNQSLDVNPF